MNTTINHNGETFSSGYFAQKREKHLKRFNEFVGRFNEIYSSYMKDGFINDNQFSDLQKIAEDIYQIYEKGQKLCLRAYFFDEYVKGTINSQLWCEISDALHKNSTLGTQNAHSQLGILGTAVETMDFNIRMLNEAMARYCDPQIEIISNGSRVPSSRSSAPRQLTSSQVNVITIKNNARLHNDNKHDDLENNKEDFIESLYIAAEEIGHFVKYFIANGQPVQYPNKEKQEDYTTLIERLSESSNNSIFSAVKILITEKTSLSKSQLAEFMHIDWDIVVDLDPESHINGLEADYSQNSPYDLTILYPDDQFISEPISKLYWFRCYNRDSDAMPTSRQMQGHINKLISAFNKFRNKVTGNILIVANTTTVNENARLIAQKICDLVYPIDKSMSDFADTKAFTCFSLNGNSCFLDDSQGMHNDRKNLFFCVNTSLPLFLDQMTHTSPDNTSLQSGVYIEEAKIKYLEDLTYRCIDIILAESEINQERAGSLSDIDPKEFYLAKKPISWYQINSNNIAGESNLTACIKELLNDKPGIHGPNYALPYDPGVGGTTALRIVAFRFSKKMPSVLIKQYTGDTWKECKKLFSETGAPLFIGADENDVSYEDYIKLCKELCDNHISHLCLFLYRKDDRNFSVRDGINTLDELRPFNERQAGILKDRIIRVLKQDETISAEEKKIRMEALNSHIERDEKNYPFIMCMYAFDKDFVGIPDYIKRFLDGKYQLTEIQKNILIWISIITEYSTVSLDVELFSADESFFSGKAAHVARKLLRYEQNDKTKSRSVKIIHTSFADEILTQMLIPENGNNSVYFESICKKLVEFIKYVADSGTTCSVDAKQNIMKNLFIDKEPFDYERSTARMSHLLNGLYEGEKFKSLEAEQKSHFLKSIFRTLVDCFPDNAHFHAHYGRFLANTGRTTADLDAAIEEAAKAVYLSDGMDCIIYHILANCRRKKLRRLISDYQRLKDYPEFTQDNIDKMEDDILDLAEDASEDYWLSRSNGEAPGYICNIDMCIDLVDFCRELYGVEYDDIAIPSKDEDQYMQYYRRYYQEALTLYDEIDEIEHITERDTLQSSLSNLKARTMDMKGQLDDTLEYWKKYLSNANVEKTDRSIASRFCVTSKYNNGGYDNIDSIEDLEYLLRLSESLLNERVRIGDLACWFALNLRLSRLRGGVDELALLEDMFFHLKNWRQSTEEDTNEGKYLSMYLLIVSSIQALNNDSRASSFVKKNYSQHDKTSPMYYLKNNGRAQPTLGDVTRFNGETASKDFLELEGVITTRANKDSYQVVANGISIYFGMSRQENITSHDVNQAVTFGLLYTLDGARVIFGTLKRKKKTNTALSPLGIGTSLMCTLIAQYNGGWLVSFDAYKEEYGYLDEPSAKKHSNDTKLQVNKKLELSIVGDKDNGPELRIPSNHQKKKCWKMS